MLSSRIAALMTCHNRKDLTLNCLRYLKLQTGLRSTAIDVFLVDDGSTDGTGEAVKVNYPEAQVIQGDGNLFWCGGMRLAFAEALKKEYDFYLWLNDDITLHETALEKMLKTYALLTGKIGKDVIVVGSLCNHETRDLTYGGRRFPKYRPRIKYKMVQPADDPRQCDLFHGNCVLIPKKIALAVGNISNAYKHSAGDQDYALRAAKLGFTSWICPGYVGTCSNNAAVEQLRTKELSIHDKIKILNHPIILIRIEDFLTFAKKYHKFFWPYLYVRSFIRSRFSRLYFSLKLDLLHF